jgi:hypothetical protein
MLALVATVFLFGSADRVFLSLSIPYELQLWLFRGLALLAPVLAYSLTRRCCDAPTHIPCAASTPTSLLRRYGAPDRHEREPAGCRSPHTWRRRGRLAR